MLENTEIHLLKNLMYKVHECARNKGWWEDSRPMIISLALITSEVGEAIEACRDDKRSEKIPAFSQIEEELADIIIRVLDVAQYEKLRLSEAILAKHKYNLNRPYRHGGKKY